MSENSSLTPQEVADILNIAKNTVYELIKRGELNAYRVGRKVRVDMHEIEAYKEKYKRVKTNKKSEDASLQPNFNASPLNYVGLPYEKGFVICGQDILLDILSRYLGNHPKGVQALREHIGSYNGLYSLYQGSVQMATAHLWDGDTGQYNIPYVKSLLPGIPCVIVHLACRMQGFYVAKGNPKNITSWEDLKRSDIVIVNREKGSGSRVLLDEHLRLLGYYGSAINGYQRECFSHLAIASTVARGDADVGIGNEKAALQVQGVEFIPLQKERYELIVKKEDMAKSPVQAVLEILRSEEYKMELVGIGGYDLTELGKIVSET